MTEHSVLAVFAHPDDEAFTVGGTLARHATQGDRVALVCATRGEVGEIADPQLATADSLGDVREAELRAATHALGFDEITFLGYRDSGMAGTPDNNHPAAFVQAPDVDVMRQLVRVIRRFRPGAVLTFEPGGGYGHPDHIAISRLTSLAFHAAADPTAHPDLGAPWQAARLFHTALPRAFFVEARDQMVARGIDPGPFADILDRPRVWPDDQIHCVIDVGAYVESKWWAVHSHMTQFGPGHIFRRVPEGVMKCLMAREYFAIAWPAPAPARQLRDLFEDLDG